MKNETVLNDVDEIFDAIDKQHADIDSAVERIQNFYDKWHPYILGVLYVGSIIALAFYFG